jgi:hypothetical protein
LERPTFAGESGSLPTPLARDWRSGKASEETHAKNSRPLSEIIRLLPTPTASDGRKGPTTYKRGNPTLLGVLLPTPVKSRGYGNRSTYRNAPLRPSLDALARMGMLLPTPTATDARDRGYTYSRGNHDDPFLTLPGVVGGRLNPRFVAEMMGFPADWLDDRSRR